MSGRHQLVASLDEEGHRLDRFLARHLEMLSRSRCQQLIAEGQVCVAGKVVTKVALAIDGGAVVDVQIPGPVLPEGSPLPQDLGLPVLHEDEELLVVNKPAGMAVHPAPGTPDGTVVNAVLALVPDLPGIGGELRPGIVHRLDKDTTGVLVVAKTERALVGLQAQFRARTVEKVYRAIALGRFDLDTGGSDNAIARHPKDRKRFTGQNTDGRRDARAASTRWRVLLRYEGATLLEVSPKTGRTHQIRVHLRESGHPILGDRIYKRGGHLPRRVAEAQSLLAHQALHALRIVFDHPAGGERCTFDAPEPPEWLAAIARLEG